MKWSLLFHWSLWVNFSFFPDQCFLSQWLRECFLIATPETFPKFMAMGGKFAAYAPHHKGMATPGDAARNVLNAIQKATLEANGGQLVSHFGTKQWL
jgi:hypothetical protein